MAHQIRLRGPWEYEAVRQDGEVLHAETSLSGDASPAWAGHCLRRISFRRHFNRPTGLTPHTRVQLVVTRPLWEMTLDYNGQQQVPRQEQDGTYRLDISHALQPRNTLVLHFQPDAHTPACVEEGQGIADVRLEISEPDAPPQ